MKKYQAVAFLLSTAMTVNSVAPVFGASSDVFGHWAELTITKWQNEGRIGGYEDGTFKPDKAITRAEFVRLLNSAAPTALTSSTPLNFSDVRESDWFYADVTKAVGSKVASGFEDSTFRPGETVTRIQAAVFICNAKGLTPNEAAANNFTDAASIPAWAKGAVGAAVAAGHLSGYPDGSFGGSKGMTRAEAVSTLNRVLGGGSTTTTPSGEIDTSDRDNSSTEDNRTAEAGNMVWTSGGGGRSSKKSSSSSSSSSDKKTNNVTIHSQKDADEYEGKTLTGTTEIYVDSSGIDLKDIRFKGDVDIYADDTVAAAYIGEDTAVAAANSTVDIYFEGKTNVSGQITVIRNNVAGADKVVIRTRTPRALSASVLARVATKIVGFELNKVEAQAPVEIAEGAKINTVEAGDNAVVEVAVNDNANANVKITDNANIENVMITDNANVDIAVADKATVNKVELSDTATAKIDIAPEAKVDKITSTSTGETAISGTGTVNKIEATNPSTINKSEEVETPVDKTETTPVVPNVKEVTAKAEKEIINWSIGSMPSWGNLQSTITLDGAKVKPGTTYADLKIEQSNEGIIGMPECSEKGELFIFFHEENAKEGSYKYTLTIPAEVLEAESGYTIPKDGLKIDITINASIPVPTKIEVDKTTVTIKKGGSANIEAILKDQNGYEIKADNNDVLIELEPDENFPEEIDIISLVGNGTTINTMISVPTNSSYEENMTLPITIKVTDKVTADVPPVIVNVTLSTDDTNISNIELNCFIGDFDKAEPGDELHITAIGKDGDISVSPLGDVGTLTWTLEENGKPVDENVAKIDVIENCDKCIVTIGEGVTSDRTFTVTAKFVQNGSTNEVTNKVTINARATSVPNELDLICVDDFASDRPIEVKNGDVTLDTRISNQYNDKFIKGHIKWSIDNANVGSFSEEISNISDEGEGATTTFTVTGNDGDTATITATVVDENGNAIKDTDGNKIAQTVKIIVVASDIPVASPTPDDDYENNNPDNTGDSNGDNNSDDTDDGDENNNSDGSNDGNGDTNFDNGDKDTNPEI